MTDHLFPHPYSSHSANRERQRDQLRATAVALLCTIWESTVVTRVSGRSVEIEWLSEFEADAAHSLFEEVRESSIMTWLWSGPGEC